MAGAFQVSIISLCHYLIISFSGEVVDLAEPPVKEEGNENDLAPDQTGREDRENENGVG